MTRDPNDEHDPADERDSSGKRSSDMADADVANGEGSPANDTEARYGDDESPA